MYCSESLEDCIIKNDFVTLYAIKKRHEILSVSDILRENFSQVGITYRFKRFNYYGSDRDVK